MPANSPEITPQEYFNASILKSLLSQEIYGSKTEIINKLYWNTEPGDEGRKWKQIWTGLVVVWNPCFDSKNLLFVT